MVIGISPKYYLKYLHPIPIQVSPFRVVLVNIFSTKIPWSYNHLHFPLLSFQTWNCLVDLLCLVGLVHCAMLYTTRGNLRKHFILFMIWEICQGMMVLMQHPRIKSVLLKMNGTNLLRKLTRLIDLILNIMQKRKSTIPKWGLKFYL